MTRDTISAKFKFRYLSFTASGKLKAVKWKCGRESNYLNSPPFFSVKICVCNSANSLLMWVKKAFFLCALHFDIRRTDHSSVLAIRLFTWNEIKAPKRPESRYDSGFTCCFGEEGVRSFTIAKKLIYVVFFLVDIYPIYISKAKLLHYTAVNTASVTFFHTTQTQIWTTKTAKRRHYL